MQTDVPYTYFTDIPWLGNPLSFKIDRILPPLYSSFKWKESTLDECTPLAIVGRLSLSTRSRVWNEWSQDANLEKINVEVKFDFQEVEEAKSFFKLLSYRVKEDAGNRKMLSSFGYLPTIIRLNLSENVISEIYHDPEFFGWVKTCLVDGHEFGLRFIVNCEETPTSLATFGRMGVKMYFSGSHTRLFFDFVDIPVEGVLDRRTRFLIYKPFEDEASYGVDTCIRTVGYMASFTPKQLTPRSEELREKRRNQKPRRLVLSSNREREVYGLFLEELRKSDRRAHDRV